MTQLFNISECMEDLNDVVHMLYLQWGKYFKKTEDERIGIFKNAVIHNLKYPKLYVMKENGKLIGSFTIKEMDVDNQSVPSVWCLVIKPEYRGKGYGRKLLEHLNEICKDYPKIYLVTEHTGLYEKIGFEFVKEVDHNGETDRLYIKRQHKIKLDTPYIPNIHSTN